MALYCAVKNTEFALDFEVKRRKIEKIAQKASLLWKNVVFLQPISVRTEQMVDLAQLVRVPDCGSVGRGFESHIPPQEEEVRESLFFCFPLLLSGKNDYFCGKFEYDE